MSKLNMKEWINEIIQKKEVVAMPIMTHPGIEMIGKTVRDAVTDGQVHYNAIQALSEKYPTAAATVIMDLTVEAEAFGAEIVFPENEVPSVVGRLLNDEGAIDKLEIPALNKGRIPQYLKANMLAAKAITDRPVFAGCIGPYSLAGRLYDMSEIMMLIYINPEAAHSLLKKCSDFILRYCMALKATGVNGVVMAEPAAGLLSDEDCTQYSSVFIKEIVEKVQDDHFTVILHNCGNTGHCTRAMVATGAAAYHFGNKINMVEALKEVPGDALAMGNLDPVSLFKAAAPEEMKKATLDLLEATRSYPNFVLSSGCDTPPHTPAENIDAFFAALNEFNNA
ncbi:uroporphyrinogen decarboxylase family protein [Phocaeicola sartorii]|uniref:MtaA/CmuA family methyltransferase n=1 Tax=Phocaeicola sartorii TaxID=671267 RepID=R9IAI2_9BACT|nr:uroporphyrinogen decarboxylase family protein [Phocaeicola sartorii]EOS13855.1 MtaA/CmuA family methyltransferase [Phocaeicola sartorii]MCR1847128.1 uroporphyrinogen decarboxylase family protein [Phocaeicola sartorii]NUL00219.1 uroporphyrinogen decarboxylase family protein [Phocaeicola sartorii]